MPTDNADRVFWKEIYRQMKDEVAKENHDVKTGSITRAYWVLTLEPLLIFVKSYIFGSNFLKGRKGYLDSVHLSIFKFARNASRFEQFSIENNKNNALSEIRKEW